MEGRGIEKVDSLVIRRSEFEDLVIRRLVSFDRSGFCFDGGSVIVRAFYKEIVIVIVGLWSALLTIAFYVPAYDI